MLTLKKTKALLLQNYNIFKPRKAKCNEQHNCLLNKVILRVCQNVFQYKENIITRILKNYRKQIISTANVFLGLINNANLFRLLIVFQND